MNFTIEVWRQSGPDVKGHFVTYHLENISPDASFLEMLDILNEKLALSTNDTPITFDHDCREGICGACGLVINGRPHGPERGITVCQLHMRKFKDGDKITIEPWRSKAFPIIKDLMVDRSALDKIIQAGGYISASTGGVPDANAIAINKEVADLAMEAAECIGCGACAAACPNASPMLFLAAKISQLALLPQGQVEAKERVLAMIQKMDELGFGNCSNAYACEVECPKSISRENIARMNREFMWAKLTKRQK